MIRETVQRGKRWRVYEDGKVVRCYGRMVEFADRLSALAYISDIEAAFYTIEQARRHDPNHKQTQRDTWDAA